MEPFIGEIRMFAGNFAPRGWEFCNGQVLPIMQYQALFSILGTVYGGNGQSNFALPDLRGRAPMGFGHGIALSNRIIGEKTGAEKQTLTEEHLPPHTHTVNAVKENGTSATPENNFLANTGGFDAEYSAENPTVQMNPGMINKSGAGQPFEITQPSLVINFIIATTGLYPPRS